MARKRYTPEEIIQHLRTAELEQSKGLTQLDAARKIGVTPVTLSRWKAEFGGLRVDQAKRLKDLEQEATGSRDFSTNTNECRRYGTFPCPCANNQNENSARENHNAFGP